MGRYKNTAISAEDQLNTGFSDTQSQIALARETAAIFRDIASQMKLPECRVKVVGHAAALEYHAEWMEKEMRRIRLRQRKHRP